MGHSRFYMIASWYSAVWDQSLTTDYVVSKKWITIDRHDAVNIDLDIP